MLNLGIYKHCKKKIWNKIQSLLFNIIQGGESSFLGEREREVFVSNLDGFSSDVLLVLQVEVLQPFTVLVLAVQLHPLGSGELVKLLLLVLHLLVSLPQFEVGPAGGHLIYWLANVVNLSLVYTGGKRKSVIFLSRTISDGHQPDAGVGNLFIADVAGLLQFLVDTLDVLVQVGDGESLPTVRALRALIVVN